MTSAPLVDVVVVSYNSRPYLRSCVWPLIQSRLVRAIVVDNASQDGSLDALDDLDATLIQLPDNLGFAHGCNVGIRAGSAPYVLLLNPDASIDEEALRLLVGVLDGRPDTGAAAPKIVEPDGTLDFSLRRFPRLVSSFAQAVFLHRVFPHASWADDSMVRDESVYRSADNAEWVSGACVLVRRRALDEIGDLDEGFFLYCEDVDLCKRLWDAGYEVRYEPAAVCVHTGGASAPRAELLQVLAESRIRYAHKHQSRLGAAAMRCAVALGAATHVLVSKGGTTQRRGHLRALRTALTASDVQTPSRRNPEATGPAAVDVARNRN